MRVAHGLAWTVLTAALDKLCLKVRGKIPFAPSSLRSAAELLAAGVVGKVFF